MTPTTNPALTRRHFVAGAASLAAVPLLRAQQGNHPLTAGEVHDRIQAHIGMPWLSDAMKTTVDNLVAGDASTPVRGIATTTMATMEVIRKALAGGANMIISHETPYYLHVDKYDDIRTNPTLMAKLDFIRRNNVSIMHMHDHWHHRQPDGNAVGMARELGWEKFVDPSDPKRFTLPEQTLRTLADTLDKRLGLHNIRVVGRPDLQLRNVYGNWGFVKRELGIQLLSRPNVDVLITGETVEWEVVPFIQDMVAQGQKKALVLLGHVVSENGGMRYCADWLRAFVPEVPVIFVPAPDPFWNPEPEGRGRNAAG